jgi:putative endonuclease
LTAAFAHLVIPAKAGIQASVAGPAKLGSRFSSTNPSFGQKPESTLMKQPCAYILASKRNGTLYLGVTSNLMQRVWQHRNDLANGFTKRYGIHTLVWYEVHGTMQSAIAREKAIKEWKRAWKIELIEKTNPQWQDLYQGPH